MDTDNHMERMVASLDFNSREGSWFDMWHTHVDWDGKGTDDVAVRRKYLLEAIKSYDTFWSKLEAHSTRPYQAWILVDVTDSSEDSIYLHAPDPAGDAPFPFSIGLQQVTDTPHPQITQTFTERGFAAYQQPDNDELLFFARPGVGVPLS